MPVQGLKENLNQFVLLLVVNAFVGGMIGLERSIFPKFAEQTFGITSASAILLFIIAFGISKALTNYFTGRVANKLGRKNLLVIGWILALPIPFILIYAKNWDWVVFANILLGMSQGLTWSSTVVMKIDIVGEKNRGLAMGLNESSGYLAVGLVAYFTGIIAENYGVTPYPFYLGIGLSVIGLLLSLIFIQDTRDFVDQESKTNKTVKLKGVFLETTFRNKTLSSITQAGLVNNLNDGMIWGLLPILLISYAMKDSQIGLLTAIYPTVWGLGQLFTGKMSDHLNKKKMLFWGMLLQALAILFIPISQDFYLLAFLSGLLGLGTALVYPTFLSALADATRPEQRAESIGVFRLWRDMGYAIGAIISGITADCFGINLAIWLIAFLTLISAFAIKFRMPDKRLTI